MLACHDNFCVIQIIIVPSCVGVTVTLCVAHALVMRIHVTNPYARVLKRIYGFGLQKRRLLLEHYYYRFSSWGTRTVPKEWLEGRKSKKPNEKATWCNSRTQTPGRVIPI